MSFDPKAHLMQIARRVKNPAMGQWETRQDDYLEVKWRLVWFRDRYPHGQVETEEICVDLDRGYARYKARVSDGEGGTATGYGTETKADFTDYCERAETRALGRALAALGIGTQFVGEELSEGEHVADAPVSTLTSSEMVSSQKLNDSSNLQHPTADEVTTLIDTARAANVSLEDFGHDMRRLMNLSPLQKITKKFLREHMTMPEYDLARKQYGEKLRVGLEEDVPNYEPPSATINADASTAAPETAAEGSAAVPWAAGSSSAPTPDATAEADAAERDRQRLRQEIALWDLRISPAEIEHVIVHNSYSRARTLLWGARPQQPEPALAS